MFLFRSIFNHTFTFKPRKNTNHLRTKALGFTLIELMMVLAVIALLVSMGIPKYQKYLQKAALSTSLAQASAQKLDVELAISEQGTFPTHAERKFNLGNIRFTPQSGITGEIVADITSGAAANSTLSLLRDADGQWQCIVTSSDIQAEQLPNSCQLAAK